MAQKLGDLILFLKTDSSQYDVGLQSARTSANAVAADITRNFNAANIAIASTVAELNKLAPQLSKTVSQMATVGSQISEGLASGIRSGSSRHQAAVNEMATGVIATAKKRLGIQSPSKVFEEIGRFISEGLAIGITSGQGRVNNAITGLFGGIGRLAASIYTAQFAFQSLFSVANAGYAALIQSNVQLQQTMISTKAIIAGSSDVYVGNKKITDVQSKLDALDPVVKNVVDQIRAISLRIAGVTSNELIDLASIVAQNVGKLGGTAKDIPRLTEAFAAGFVTNKIPLFQANQEIRSIADGTIDRNSRLALNLNGLQNSDIAREKNKGNAINFLLEKLAPSIASQKEQTTTLPGVTSNLKEVQDRIGEVVGKPLEKALNDALNDLAGKLIDSNPKDASKPFTASVQKFVDELVKASSQIPPILEEIGAKISQFIATPLAQAFQEALPFIKELAVSVGRVFSGLGDSGLGAFKDLLPSLGLIAKLITEIGLAITNVFGGILSASIGQSIVQFTLMAIIINTQVIPALFAIIRVAFGSLIALISTRIIPYFVLLSQSLYSTAAAAKATEIALGLIGKVGFALVITGIAMMISRLQEASSAAKSFKSEFDAALQKDTELGDRIAAREVKNQEKELKKQERFVKDLEDQPRKKSRELLLQGIIQSPEEVLKDLNKDGYQDELADARALLKQLQDDLIDSRTRLGNRKADRVSRAKYGDPNTKPSIDPNTVTTIQTAPPASDGDLAEARKIQSQRSNALLQQQITQDELLLKQYQQQLSGVTTTGTSSKVTDVGALATFGATGNVSNAPGWVHGHFQSNTTAADLIKDVSDVIKKLLTQGIPVNVNGYGDIPSNASDTEIQKAVEMARKAHNHSGDGRSVDVFVPAGTKVPVPLSDIRNTPNDRGGINGVLPSGNTWVGHLAKIASKASNTNYSGQGSGGGIAALKLSKEEIAAAVFTAIGEAPTREGRQDVIATLLNRRASLAYGATNLAELAKQKDQFTANNGYTRAQISDPEFGKKNKGVAVYEQTLNDFLSGDRLIESLKFTKGALEFRGTSEPVKAGDIQRNASENRFFGFRPKLAQELISQIGQPTNPANNGAAPTVESQRALEQAKARITSAKELKDLELKYQKEQQARDDEAAKIRKEQPSLPKQTYTPDGKPNPLISGQSDLASQNAVKRLNDLANESQVAYDELQSKRKLISNDLLISLTKQDQGDRFKDNSRYAGNKYDRESDNSKNSGELKVLALELQKSKLTDIPENEDLLRLLNRQIEDQQRLNQFTAQYLGIQQQLQQVELELKANTNDPDKINALTDKYEKLQRALNSVGLEYENQTDKIKALRLKEDQAAALKVAERTTAATGGIFNRAIALESGQNDRNRSTVSSYESLQLIDLEERRLKIMELQSKARQEILALTKEERALGAESQIQAKLAFDITNVTEQTDTLRTTIESLKGGFASTFSEGIMNVNSFKDVLGLVGNLLNQIAKKLADMASNFLTNQLFESIFPKDKNNQSDGTDPLSLVKSAFAFGATPRGDVSLGDSSLTLGDQLSGGLFSTSGNADQFGNIKTGGGGLFSGISDLFGLPSVESAASALNQAINAQQAIITAGTVYLSGDIHGLGRSLLGGQGGGGLLGGLGNLGFGGSGGLSFGGDVFSGAFGGGFGGFSSFTDSFFSGGGGGLSFGTAIPAGLGFAGGGEIRGKMFDLSALTSKGISESLRRESAQSGSQAMLIAASVGEEVLPIREAMAYRRMYPNGIPTYADGGTVGGGVNMSTQSSGGFTVNVPVTVQGGNSKDDQNTARLLGAELEQSVRGVIIKEQRPGGILNQR